VSSIVGVACVFPDVDQGRGAGVHRPGERVVYHPPLQEFCGFSDWRLPNDNIVPPPPQDALDAIDTSSEESEEGSGDEEESDDSSVLNSEGESDEDSD